MNPGETQQKIFEAARNEFACRGLSGARLQSIASKAGVNKALIHYYFRSKEKLYEAVFHDIMGRVWSSATSTIRALDEKEYSIEVVIRTIVTSYFNTFQTEPEIPRLFLREFSDGGSFIPTIISSMIDSFGEIPKTIYLKIAEGIKAGTIRQIDPAHAIMNIIGMCLISFILKPMVSLYNQKIVGKENPIDDSAYLQTRIDAILDMVNHGIFTRSTTL